MNKQLSLKIILIIAIAGMLFSGYLSYGELFSQVCPINGGCTAVASIPACVYGFIMYTIVLIISAIGLKSKK
ncbi:MAG: hypothetical protein P1P90_03555 [Patescibacteria group bacterium]|nr:hypothetical protein [Patescibacteria group bacterium]